MGDRGNLLALWSCLALAPVLAPLTVTAASGAGTPVSWRADRMEALLDDPGRILLAGRVTIETAWMTVEADRAEYDTGREAASVSGRVWIRFPEGEIRAREFEYSFREMTGSATGAVFSFPPIFGHCREISFPEPGRIVLFDGKLSHCDVHASTVSAGFRSAELEIGRRARVGSLVMRLGPAPVFYLPRYEYDLTASPGEEKTLPLSLRPEYDSTDGFQVYGRIRLPAGRSSWLASLDHRGRRGFGTGLDFRETGRGLTGFETYFISDRQTGFDRFRLDARHRRTLGPDEAGKFIARFSRESDPDFLADLFPRRPLPAGDLDFAYYAHRFEPGDLSLRLAGQAGRREETRYLPEVAWETPARPLGPLSFRNSLRAAALSSESGGQSKETFRVLLEPRFSTGIPLAAGVLRPHLGGSAAWYTRAADGQRADRRSLAAGGELAWRFERLYRAGGDSPLNHQLRPVIGFSRRTYSRRPEEFFPLDAVDTAGDHRLLTLEIGNRLERDRPGRPPAFATLALESDYCLRTSRFQSLRTGIELRGSRLGFSSLLDYHPPGGDWRLAESTVAWNGDRASLSLAHRRQADEVNILASSASWTAGAGTLEAGARYDLEKGGFEGRELVLRRRLHCWDAAIGIGREQGETRFTFNLTPRALGRDEAASLRPSR